MSTSPLHLTTTRTTEDGTEIKIHWSAEPDYCIDSWMSVFEQVLLVEGFDKRAIIEAACYYAFNENRDPLVMKEVAEFYGLAIQDPALRPK